MAPTDRSPIDGIWMYFPSQEWYNSWKSTKKGERVFNSLIHLQPDSQSHPPHGSRMQRPPEAVLPLTIYGCITLHRNYTRQKLWTVEPVDWWIALLVLDRPQHRMARRGCSPIHGIWTFFPSQESYQAKSGKWVCRRIGEPRCYSKGNVTKLNFCN